MGFFDAVITIFLQRHHSKEICDRFFGHIEEAFAENGVFGVPSLLSMIERITSNTTSGAKLRGRSVNPMATSRLKDFFGGMFNQNTTDYHMPDRGYHIHLVAGPGVKDDMQNLPRLRLYESNGNDDDDENPAVNIYDLLGNGTWIPPEGWVVCIHSPSSPRVDALWGYKYDSTITEDATPKRFYTTTGTVAADKESKDPYRLDQNDSAISKIGFNGRNLEHNAAWNSDIVNLRDKYGGAALWPESKLTCLPRNWIAMTTEDARRICLPTFEFVKASLLHYQPKMPAIADDVTLDPFPVPQAVPGDIVRDDDDRISALSKGCVVQQELESFATAHRSDRNTQLHFGQLLIHCCESNPGLRDMKNVIRRVQRLASSDSGKLSERASNVTMMAPLPPYFPAPAKSAWQLFCADFKRQRKEDEQGGRVEAVMAMDTAVESASGSDRRKCLSCDCPLDQSEGGLICAECNELIDAGNDNDDDGDGDDECEGSSSSGSSGSSSSSSSSSSKEKRTRRWRALAQHQRHER